MHQDDKMMDALVDDDNEVWDWRRLLDSTCLPVLGDNVDGELERL